MIDPTCRIKKIMQYLVRALGDDSNRIKLLKQKLEVLYANAIENEHKAGKKGLKKSWVVTFNIFVGQHVEFFDDNNKIWRIGSIVSMRKKCQELVLSWQGAEVIVQRGFVRKLGRSAVIQKKLEYEKRQKHQAEVIEDLGDASKGKRSRDDMVQ